MKTVLVNVPFRDVYTGKMYEAGKTYPMSEERVKEVKEVNPNFITVVGNATAPVEKGTAVETPVGEIPVGEVPVGEVPVEKVPAKTTRGKNKK